MLGFVIATLLPVPLLILSSALGGYWAWVALIYLTVFTALLDHILPRSWRNLDAAQEFKTGHGLSIALGVIHLLAGLTLLTLVAGCFRIPHHPASRHQVLDLLPVHLLRKIGIRTTPQAPLNYKVAPVRRFGRLAHAGRALFAKDKSRTSFSNSTFCPAPSGRRRR